MAGKFLRRDAIIDVVKSAERTHAIQKRDGLSGHPVRFTTCGCPDPSCGGWHTIDLRHTVPTAERCDDIIRADNRRRKPVGPARLATDRDRDRDGS